MRTGLLRLQWSHHLSGMEIRKSFIRSTRLTGLQWSHHLSGMEICARAAGFGRWTTGFNGATTFRGWKSAPPPAVEYQPFQLQWSHHLSGMEIKNRAALRPAQYGFNGATTFRGWKFRGLSSGCRHRQRFNGATTFRGWKSDIATVCAAVSSPLQWSHHLSGMEMWPASPARTTRYCFNGATTFRGWKYGCARSCPWSIVSLQWSHHLSGMEMAVSWGSPVP